MNTRKSVDDFLSQKTIALVGLSRKGNQFSNMARKELKKKGYTVIPVNPATDEIDGEKCYPNLAAVKDMADAALVMTPSSQVTAVVQDAADSGIKNVWIQQGCESDEAIQLATDRGLSLVSGECIMMFAEPAGGLHKFHRFIWNILGKLPK